MRWIVYSLTLLSLLVVINCPAPEPIVACTSDVQCPLGYRCDSQGRCVRPVDTHADSGSQEGLALDRDATATDRARRDRTAGDVRTGDNRNPGDSMLLDRPPFDALLADHGAADQLSTDRGAVDRVASDQDSSDSRAEDASCADSGCDSGPVVTDCRNGLICSYPTPHCDTDTGLCVQCLSASDCNDDSNVCTDKVCNAGVCGQQYNTASCDDGEPCNGSDTCGGGSCMHSGNPCSGTRPLCRPADGACLECTTSAQCQGSRKPLCDTNAGTCVQCLNATDCSDDGKVCTSTACNSSGQCVHINNSAACNDGDICNGSDTCSGGSCNLHSNIDPCANLAQPHCSVPLQQCVECLSGGNCDDGLFCTTPSVCGSNGTCSITTSPCAGQHPLCDESNSLCKCRVSPNSCTGGTICQSNGRCRKTINRDIATRDDDGFQDPYSSNTVLGVGENFSYMSLYGADHPGALRFVGVSVPNGARILAAYLQVYGHRYIADSPDLDISLQAADNAPQLAGNVAFEIDNLAKTNSSVHLAGTDIGVGWKTSPDLTTLVQEVVDRPGWASGKALLFILRSRAGTSYDFMSYEGGYASRLSVSYEY